jgi:hypothetical protein
MPKGLHRESDECVMVDYGKHLIPIPRKRYEVNRYQPPFEALPTKEEYDALQASANIGQPTA